MAKRKQLSFFIINFELLKATIKAANVTACRSAGLEFRQPGADCKLRKQLFICNEILIRKRSTRLTEVEERTNAEIYSVSPHFGKPMLYAGDKERELPKNNNELQREKYLGLRFTEPQANSHT